jgi:two-component system chemotaxis response regulator CheY
MAGVLILETGCWGEQMGALKQVLVVDDEFAVREVVAMALDGEGYEVVTAPNGADALELARRSHPAMVLLDMRMPIMNGWQFARAYRETPGPHAPIVVMTAAQDPSAWARDIDADDFLSKPFDIDELYRVVLQYAGHA